MIIDFNRFGWFEKKYMKEEIERAANIYIGILPDVYGDIVRVDLDVIVMYVEDGSDSYVGGAPASIKRSLINSSEFYLKVNSHQWSGEVILHLAHEFCHFAQFVTGMLDVQADGITWLGDRYDVSLIRDKNAPWEKDAKIKSISLYRGHPDSGQWH